MKELKKVADSTRVAEIDRELKDVVNELPSVAYSEKAFMSIIKEDWLATLRGILPTDMPAHAIEQATGQLLQKCFQQKSITFKPLLLWHNIKANLWNSEASKVPSAWKAIDASVKPPSQGAHVMALLFRNRKANRQQSTGQGTQSTAGPKKSKPPKLSEARSRQINMMLAMFRPSAEGSESAGTGRSCPLEGRVNSDASVADIVRELLKMEPDVFGEPGLFETINHLDIWLQPLIDCLPPTSPKDTLWSEGDGECVWESDRTVLNELRSPKTQDEYPQGSLSDAEEFVREMMRIEWSDDDPTDGDDFRSRLESYRFLLVEWPNEAERLKTILLHVRDACDELTTAATEGALSKLLAEALSLTNAINASTTRMQGAKGFALPSLLVLSRCVRRFL